MEAQPALAALDYEQLQSQPVLTVTEAAQVLRIGRSTAYEQARRFVETDGLEGIPAIRLGKTLRVPTRRVLALIGLDLEAR